MKNITRIALIALGFYTATILPGCSSGTSAPMPAPPAIAINFSGGNSRTISQGQSMLVTVNISNDSSGKGVTWTLSGPGTLSKQTSTSVQYDAAATVSSATSATITATSIADTTKFAVTNITITPTPAPITINFTGGSSQTISQGQSMPVTVNISNDPSGKGVTWTLSGPGALSKQTTTSVQYDAAATVASATTATITATSVADTTKFAVMNVTITPAPAPITISFTGGSSQTISQGQSMLSVNIQNDPSGKGVTWKLSGPGTLSKQTSTSVQYDAGATVPSALTATITATSVADTTKFAVMNITITPPARTISTASLPDGVVGTAYSRAIQATGGVAPFTWVLSVGALPHNLNLNNSTTGTLTISGTPDMQRSTVQFTISVTDSVNQSASQSYTVNINSPSALTIGTSSVPPGTINVPYTFTFLAAGGSSSLTWNEIGALPAGLAFANNGTLSGTPTVTGSFLITVKVTDGHGPMATKPFLVVVYPAAVVLSGRYVFQFQGFNTGGAFAAVGSFVADAFGTIGDAALDTNGVIGPPVTNLGLSGTYSIDANNVGTITLTSSQGKTTFHFVPNPNVSSNSISTGARIVEFNNIKSGTGFIATQDVSAFSTSSIIHNYTFNFVGSTASLGRAAAVGRLTADGQGGFSGGVMDINQAGTVSNVTFGGSYDLPATNINGTPTTNGKGTASLNTPLGMLNFTFYIQNIDTITNAPVLIFLGSDPVSNTLPLLSGSMAPNAEAFTNNSLAGSLIFGTTGLTSVGHSDVTLGILTITSGGNYTLKADENSDGVITTANSVAGTYNVDPSGRVTLTGGNHPPVLYLTGTNSGYILGTDGNVSTGTVIARTVPLSLEGTLLVCTGVPVTASQENDYGTLTFGTVNVTGSLNISSSTNFQPNKLVAGTYSLGSDGRGTLSVTSGLYTGTSVFYVIGHSRLALLNSVNAGDTAPVLFSGYCLNFVISPLGRVDCR